MTLMGRELTFFRKSKNIHIPTKLGCHIWKQSSAWRQSSGIISSWSQLIQITMISVFFLLKTTAKFSPKISAISLINTRSIAWTIIQTNPLNWTSLQSLLFLRLMRSSHYTSQKGDQGLRRLICSSVCK